MKLLKVFAIAAMAMVSSVSAQAGVVLSNLGTSGTDASKVSSTSTNQSTSSRNFTGFTVGSSNVTLDSINVGLYQATAPSTVSTTLQLFSSVGGLPGTLIATSNPTLVDDSNPTLGPKSLFNFTFSSTTLSANTSYWVGVTLGGPALAWYSPTSFSQPTAVGDSGFVSLGTAAQDTNGTTISGPALTFALFTSDVPPAAIPEPALTSLLCLSGIALIRRRMKK